MWSKLPVVDQGIMASHTKASRKIRNASVLTSGTVSILGFRAGSSEIMDVSARLSLRGMGGVDARAEMPMASESSGCFAAQCRAACTQPLDQLRRPAGRKPPMRGIHSYCRLASRAHPTERRGDCSSPSAGQIPHHKSRGLLDEHCHRLVRYNLLVQHGRMRQRLD
jgi:hypothetical protein